MALIFALAAVAWPACATPLYPSGREAGDVIEELRRNPHRHDPETLRRIFGGHVTAPRYTPPPVTHFGTPELPAPSYMPPPVTNYGTPFYQELPD
jgi:hypothetical protein